MPLRPLILDHFWLKVFSLVLATLIWLAVRGNVADESASGHKVTREFPNRPVLVLTESGAHEPLLIDPPRVNVAVQGSVGVLAALNEQDIQVFVRLTNGRTGTAPVRVHVPAGVTVSRLQPLTVAVRSAGVPENGAR